MESLYSKIDVWLETGLKLLLMAVFCKRKELSNQTGLVSK